MIAVSGALLFAGYQLMVYGWSQIQGSNAGFFDILWPGRYAGPFPDPPSSYGQPSGGSSSTSKAPSSSSLPPGAPGAPLPAGA